MKITNFKMSIVELVAVILVITGVTYIVLIIMNSYSPEVSEVVLVQIDSNPPLKTGSRDKIRRTRSKVSEWASSDTDSDSSEVVSTNVLTSEVSLEQLETLSSESAGLTDGIPVQEQIEANPLQSEWEKAIEELSLKAIAGLAEANELLPIVSDYQEKREEIVSRKAPSQEIIDELKALDDDYEPYVSRLVEIRTIVTDTEVIEHLGDWVREEADAIFGPLGW